MPDPVTIATTMSLTDFLLGIAGNLIAKHADPTVNSLASKIYERLSSGGMSVPPNHDVERGCRTALSQALTMLAQAIEFHVQRPKTWLEGLRNSRDEHGNWKPLLSRMQTPEGIWFDEFIREIRSDEALQTFRIPVGDASSLNEAMRNRPNDTQAELFRKGLVDWTERRVQKGSPPACFLEFIGDRQPPDPQVPRGIGWPMKPDTPSVRVSLFQVWSLFLQDYLKKNEEVFRILTAEWLSSIDSRLKAGLLSRDELIAAINEPLGELREELIAPHDDVLRLFDEIGNISISVGELLPLIIAFRQDVGQHFKGLRGELISLMAQMATLTQGQAKLVQGQKDMHDDVRATRDSVRTLLNRAPKEVPLPAPLQLPQGAAGKFYGRKKQTKELETALREKRSVAVVGPAGYGKTAMSAVAVEAIVGTTPDSLAVSPYPNGVLFLNLYAHRGLAESVWHTLANDLAGPEFYETRPAQFRAVEACRGKQILVIFEGGEEADGREGRATIAELSSILAPENRSLLLTREKSQTVAGATISIEEPLSETDAAWLFDGLTKKRVQGAVRTRVLKLLQGHPLALTWAGGLLAREDEDPADLVKDWESSPTRSLSDPAQSRHTLAWLFGRSVRSLDENGKQVLAAAGLLAPTLFSIDLIRSAVAGEVRMAIKQLIDQGLLRRDSAQPRLIRFTHVLGYQYARDASRSEAQIKIGLAVGLRQQMAEKLEVGTTVTDGLGDLLQHAAALLRSDTDQELGTSLASYLLYDGHERLHELGRLDWVSTVLGAVEDWFRLFQAENANEPFRRREWAVLFDLLGERARAQGNLPEAQRLFGESLRLRQRLAKSDPANAEWQRDLSVSFNKLGDLATAQGNLPEAQRLFGESLRIAQRLVKSDPANAEWQRDLAISSERLGDLAVAQGDLQEATALLEKSRAIWQRFIDLDPTNLGLQRGITVPLNRLGDLARAQANLPEAQRLFGESLRIAQRLAESDPANAVWQRDLSVSFNKLGDLATVQGNLPEAQRLFGESDPANAAWQRDLSVSFNKLGDLATVQGNLPEAQRLFGESLRIRERLAESDPTNAEWQRDMSVSFGQLGDLATAQGNLPEAQRLFGESLRIAQRLAESDPANAEWQRDLSVSFGQLGGLAASQGNLPEAQRLFGETLRIQQRLAESDPANAAWQRDLWVSYWRVADVLEQQGSDEAMSYCRKAHDTLTTLVEKDLFVSSQDLQFLDRLRAKLGQQ